MTEDELCFCLKFFISDVRKEDGLNYPPQSLKSIFYMLQHYLQYECNKPFSLFKSEAFVEARNVLDAEMRLSAREGNSLATYIGKGERNVCV